MAKRPNFLLFINDQHRVDYLGCNGHPVLQTPHIDSIAARGTSFKRFYVATPVCMPNRSTLMTSNRPIEEWGALLGDVPAATAILDRLLEGAEIVRMSGRSYRLRNAQVAAATKKNKSGGANPPPE